MEYALYGVAAIGLAAGAFIVVRSPSFWIDFGKELFIRLLPSLLKLFENRPKTDEEWKEWRRLSSMKEADMSPKERTRFKELKKLNWEFKK